MNRNWKGLKRLRRGVDAVDRRVLGLLNRRMRLVREISRVKRAERLPTYAPEREVELLRALVEANRGPLTSEALRAIYREILSAGRAAGELERVAYLGPEATFTHLAARARFGSLAAYLPVRSIADVFYEVDRRKADYGVVPVENSTEGVVNYTLDQFIESDLKICAEELIPIRHVLMANVSRMSAIRSLCSHPQVFGQCRHWIDDHLPRVRTVEVSSTAEAALRARRSRNVAAIGTELAARMYGMKVLAEGVEDLPGNYTRFFVLGKSWARPTRRDKTSIMFAVKDRVGALYAMLQPFKRHGINLTSIESRPSRKRPWEYYFFVDFSGHVENRGVERALGELERICSVLKVLGSYPAADPLAR